MHTLRLSLALLVVALALPARAAELSPEQILQRCGKAILQPLQYRSVAKGAGDATVFQKRIAPGVWATAMVRKKPVKRALLTDGKSSFVIFPDRKIAVETAAVGANDNLMVDLINSELDGTLPVTAELLKTEQRNGRPYYKLELTLLPDSLAKWKEVFPKSPAAILPAKILVEVDGTTFLPSAMALVPPGEKKPYWSKIVDYEIHPALKDSLFQVPAGYETKRPATYDEYRKIVEPLEKPAS